MIYFSIIVPLIIHVLLIFCVVLLIKRFIGSGSDTSPSISSSETGGFSILMFFGKIIMLAILGFIYFLITIMSGMMTDACGVDGCKILPIGWGVGALWMLLSFIVTVLSTLQNTKRALFKYQNIFMPHSAILIFFGIVALSMALEGI